MKITEIEKLLNEYNELNKQINEGQSFTITVGESLCNRHSTNAKRIKITPPLKKEIDIVIQNYIESLEKRKAWVKEALENP